ncbi:hypothetical protein H0H92_006099 [Tricholoma furcatifolium]|nr:hypothetical protein H0H92_006099 [Tricholoma furcatifolium]
MFKLLTILVLASLTFAAPIQKRIAQTIADATQDWEQACLAAGGGQQCNPISQVAFTSLLAAGQNCDQQNAADQMIDLAKTLNNDPEMIRLSQIFVQQPRNAVRFQFVVEILAGILTASMLIKPDSLQVPYCQVAPKNEELNGLFHCQFAGSNFSAFSGDQTGNLPLGVSAVTPPGSCPAKPDGPVPDGVQLNTLVQSPIADASASTAPSPTASSTAAVEARSPTYLVEAASPPSSSSTSPSTGFQLENGEEAKALNAQFASLTVSSSCTDGEDACVNGGFAQCVNGTFAITQCAGSTICAALPLVDKPGTSIACTTAADRDARIAATGA